MAQFCIEDSGFSMYKLAKLFKVVRSTIYRWMEHEKEFSDGVEHGRRTWEGLKIHQSLVKKAIGFTYTETTREAHPVIREDEEGNKMITGHDLMVTKRVRKYYPPDVAAIKHWQVNRHPEKWQDRQNIDATVDANITVTVVKFADDGDNDPK